MENASESTIVNHAVICPCGVATPVSEKDYGWGVSCSCGRRVVVPLGVEFETHPHLPSAATVEKRVEMLLREGALPPQGDCVACGDAANPISFEIQCEWHVTHSDNVGIAYAMVFLFLLPFGIFAMRNQQSEYETTGRDTSVAAPTPVCEMCLGRCRGTSKFTTGFLLLAATLAAVVSGLVIHSLVGATVLLVIGVGIWTWHSAGNRRRQRSLKSVLGVIPAYRHVLKQYPKARVVMPESVMNEVNR